MKRIMILLDRLFNTLAFWVFCLISLGVLFLMAAHHNAKEEKERRRVFYSRPHGWIKAIGVDEKKHRVQGRVDYDSLNFYITDWDSEKSMIFPRESSISEGIILGKDVR